MGVLGKPMSKKKAEHWTTLDLAEIQDNLRLAPTQGQGVWISMDKHQHQPSTLLYASICLANHGLNHQPRPGLSQVLQCTLIVS